MKPGTGYHLICVTGFQSYSMEAQTIVKEKMYANDAFSQWLGIEIGEVSSGHCVLTLVVRKDMTNGFGIAHGGITYSLSDSALAFASNGQGKLTVSVETSISHIKAVHEGDRLKAIAREVSASKRMGHYEVNIFNQHEELVAWFKGTVYKKEEIWK